MGPQGHPHHLSCPGLERRPSGVGARATKYWEKHLEGAGAGVRLRPPAPARSGVDRCVGPGHGNRARAVAVSCHGPLRHTPAVVLTSLRSGGIVLRCWVSRPFVGRLPGWVSERHHFYTALRVNGSPWVASVLNSGHLYLLLHCFPLKAQHRFLCSGRPLHPSLVDSSRPWFASSRKSGGPHFGLVPDVLVQSSVYC